MLAKLESVDNVKRCNKSGDDRLKMVGLQIIDQPPGATEGILTVTRLALLVLNSPLCLSSTWQFSEKQLLGCHVD
jgi:hypothetical protein